MPFADPVGPVLLALAFICLGAALGGRLVERVGVPAVVGELLVGLVVGNAGYWLGSPTLTVLRLGEPVRQMAQWAWTHGGGLSEAARQLLPPGARESVVAALGQPAGVAAVSLYLFIDQLSRLGVVLLLFLVGLETSLPELARVGGRAVTVAAAGVVAPLGLAAVAAHLLVPTTLPDELFLGGVLTATSVGITARVLHDLHQGHRPEAHLILGAAVVDDVLGLVLLAVLSGLVVTGRLEAAAVAWVAVKAAAFLAAAVAVGWWLTPRLARRLGHRLVQQLRLVVGVALAFVLAWLASQAGLATIVGAFAAGVLVEQLFAGEAHGEPSLREVLSPLESLLVPVFFVLLGLQVQLETLRTPGAWALAAALLVAAVAGKLVSGWFAGPGMSRWAVGWGMLPRGEVGLVFAGVGRALGALTPAQFSALVLVIVATTLLGPPLLARSLARQPR